MSRPYNPNNPKVNNISEVVGNKNRLLGTPFRINERGGFYLIGDQEIPQEEYEKQFPTSLKNISDKGLNPNARNQLF